MVLACAAPGVELTEVRKQSGVLSKTDDVSQFLDKVKSLPPGPAKGRGRLVFAMDATMSRQPTWDRALSIQSQMFSETVRAGPLLVQLVYFRGFNECRASKWVANPEALARLMTAVECRGGNTQISRVLAHVRVEAGKSGVNAVVFVGDAFEEDIDQVCKTAGEIGLLGVPFFMFLEGDDVIAAQAFKEIARLTGGAYFRLDSTSPAVLADLLGAVAAYATGGRQALESRSKAGNASQVLLRQLK